jgi:transcription elongation factor SPT5
MPDETHPDDNDLPAGADRDDRRHRELDRQRELAASMDAEKQAELLRQKYGGRHKTEFSGEVVPQRLLLPTTDDPSIWGIACKPKKEREVVIMIQKRLEDRMHGRNPLPITAAFERGGTMEGWVYIEARKQADVFEATEGIMHAYPRSKLMLIPMNEMPDLLKTRPKEMVEPGAFVRITGTGLYGNDLAQVYEVESNGLNVTVRLVPRLDYGLKDDDLDQSRKRPRGFGSRFNKVNRPPKRLFSEVEAKKKHMRHLTQQSTLNRRSFTYFNQTYEDGYLLMDIKLQKLQTENVRATLEESAWFTAGAEDGTENIDLSAIKATLQASSDASSYHPGDKVEIWQGEQQGIAGKVERVQNDIVTMKVESGTLAGKTVEAPVKTLRKRFKDGDSVKVLSGSKHADETGMVIKIKDDKVVVLLDTNHTEVTVFSKDLTEAKVSGMDTFSKYDLYDLVQMDASTVGVVIKAEKEHLRVLLQDGSVRDTFPSQIASSLERRRHAVATDRDGSEVRAEDTVKEFGGENRQGQVLYIHRNYLFIKSRTYHENAGVFVARSNNVTTVAAKGGRNANAGPDFTKMNPSLQRNGANGTGNNNPMPPPKTMGRDRLLGKTVGVKKGPYKGLMGIVKDTTDTAARVELHSKNKVITVPKDILNIKDPVTGQNIGTDQFRGRKGAGQGGAGSRVPESWSGSRTPMAGNATPGGRTPAWGLSSGSRTPAWSSGDGGKTPAWSGGSGGRTPAWSSGGAPKTAYGGATTYGGYNDGSRTAYGGGNDGSRTAYGGVSSTAQLLLNIVC